MPATEWHSTPSAARGAAPFAILVAAVVLSGDVSPLVGPYLVHVSSVTFYPADLGSLIALLLLWHERRLRVPTPMRLFGATLVACTVWGLATYPAQAALNGVRAWWWLAIAVIVGSSCRPSGRLLVTALATVEGLGLYGLAKHGVQSADSGFYLNGRFITLLPLTETGAFLLLILAIMLAAEQRMSPRVQRTLIAIAAVLVVLAQQRTVWVAAIVTVPLLTLRWIRRTHGYRPEAAYTAIGAGALASPIAVWLLTHSDSIEGSVQNQGTLRWRLDSWRATVELIHGKVWVIGNAAGSAPLRSVAGVLTDVEPHNLYVEVVYQFGLLGFIGLIVLLIAGWRTARVSHTWTLPALVLASLMSGITYGPSVVVGLALGAALIPWGEGASRTMVERQEFDRRNVPEPAVGILSPL